MNPYTPPPPQFQQPPVYTSSAGDDFSDWDSVEEQPERSLIPKGDYKMSLEKINQEAVKSGDNVGKPRYNCHFTITDDKQTGRKIFLDFMPHSEISRVQVKALAQATNTPLQGNMLQVLIAAMDRDFIANVGISKGTGKYQDQNIIWVFKLLPAAQYQPPQQAYAPAPPMQRQRPANAQLGSDGVTWWIPNPNSPSGWEIWQ